MKKSKLILSAVAAVGLFTFMIAPEKASEGQKAPFAGRNFAHRGLHTKDGVTPENSLPAFKAAATLGYGVELDVHLSKDGQVVVFHDDTLKRLCGVDDKIENLTYNNLCKLKLAGTDHKIPLLSEVMDELDGVPIILEIKRGAHNKELCEKTLGYIDSYKGAVCVESFDPTIVRWFKKHAPDILRGQLSAEKLEGQPKALAFALSHLLLNFLSRPNFVAYGIGKKPLSVRLCELMGAMKVTWTSHDAKNEKNSDAVIFEHYLPNVRYR